MQNIKAEAQWNSGIPQLLHNVTKTRFRQPIFWVSKGMIACIRTKPRIAAGALSAAMLLGGCTHHTSPTQELNNAVAPFTQTRDDTIVVVATAKRSLGAADLNSLAVAYTTLEEKANIYAHFVVDSVRSGSFDNSQNAQYAANLDEAVSTFDKAFAQIVPAKLASNAPQNAWVSPFAAAVTADWAKYGSEIGSLTPQMRADLIKDLQLKMVWPNYENIATEPVAPAQK